MNSNAEVLTIFALGIVIGMITTMFLIFISSDKVSNISKKAMKIVGMNQAKIIETRSEIDDLVEQLKNENE